VTGEQRALALAAIDPNAAMRAISAPAIDSPLDAEMTTPFIRRGPDHGLTFAVEVETPAPYKRWRFFLFYCLVKLAAWVYPFKFEIYRTPKPWELEEQ
jgi:hypothetical protein